MKTGNLETLKRLRRPIKRTKIAFKRVFLKTVLLIVELIVSQRFYFEENICLHNRGQ